MAITVNGQLQFDTSILEDLSELALVASDSSYKGRLAIVGESLQPFNDTPQYGNPQAPFGLTSQFLTANYVVDRIFDEPSDKTGFKAIAYKNLATNDIVLAFAGTDGLNGKDWWGNTFHYGWNQWAANIGRIRAYLANFVNNGTLSAKISFVGQSLGGALAQYAAYDFVSQNPNIALVEKKKISLVTFNALGGVAGLSDNVGSFNKDLLNGLGQAVHYVVENDLISRLGMGHVGGQVKKFSWTDLNASAASPFNRLDPIDAHRIESAFYRYLSAGKNFFAEAVPVKQDYLVFSNLQKLASAYGNLEGKATVRGPQAFFQMAAGLMAASLTAAPGDVNEFMRVLITAYRDAGQIAALKAEILFDTDWSTLFRAIAIRSPAAAAGSYAGAIALGLLSSALGNKLDDVNTALQAEFAAGAGVSIVDLDFADWDARAELFLQTQVSGTPLSRPEIDREELARQLTSGPSWFDNAMVYVGKAIGGVAGVALDAVTFGTFVVKADAQAYTTVLDAAVKTGTSIAQSLQMIRDSAKARAAGIGNAFADLALKAAGTLYDVATTFPLWKDFRLFPEAYANELRQGGLDGRVRSALNEAKDIVESAGETVQIVQGHAKNPFDTPAYDPDAAAIPSSTIEEGHGRTFTVFLPYEAGEGGQHVKVKLDGANANNFRVIAGDEIPVVNGEFELDIAEGHREISFNLQERGDVDADSTLTLSATLVDADGIPTHQTHLEANLMLDATEEGGIDGLHSTFALTWTSTAVTSARSDLVEAQNGVGLVGGDYGHDRIYAGVETDFDLAVAQGEGTGIAARGILIYGGPGDDIVVGGDRSDVLWGGGGEDRISGGAGDDFLVGDAEINPGGYEWSFSAPADDPWSTAWIAVETPGQPAGFDAHDTEGIPIDGQRVEGPDEIYGGSGNDRIYAQQGDDLVDGGSGDDLIEGGEGDDKDRGKEFDSGTFGSLRYLMLTSLASQDLASGTTNWRNLP
jgi:hypothetical protein